jgi:hypothetical protein
VYIKDVLMSEGDPLFPIKIKERVDVKKLLSETDPKVVTRKESILSYTLPRKRKEEVDPFEIIFNLESRINRFVRYISILIISQDVTFDEAVLNRALNALRIITNKIDKITIEIK